MQGLKKLIMASTNFNVLRNCSLLIAVLNIVHSDPLHDSALKAHNEYRERHGCSPLALDYKSSTFAHYYAEYLVSIDTLKHSPRGKYGENLYYYSVSGQSLPDDETLVKMAVDSWYDEVKLYNYDKPEFSSATGHFTQVVWKSSKVLGIGLKRSADEKKVYIVAEYSPPGNYAGLFKENVPRTISTASKTTSSSTSQMVELSITSWNMTVSMFSEASSFVNNVNNSILEWFHRMWDH